MTKEELQRLRAAQDTEEALTDACRDRIGEQEWKALIGFNTYCAGRLGLVLEFYRRENGEASYRFRPSTPEEAQNRAEGQWEDQL